MQRRMLSMTAAAGLGLALAVAMASPSAAAPAATGAAGTAGQRSAAAPTSCRTLDFDKASVDTVVWTGSPGTRYRLTVSGTKPASNVSVKLVPLVYVQQPQYWGIEVTGCSSGIGLPVLMSYTATYDFTGPFGTCGIEVVGATKRQQFDLAACTSVPLPGTSWVLDPASLGVPVPQGVSVTARFSATTVSGFASCNTYGADYATDADGSFKIGIIRMTARACDPVTSTAESTYISRLRAATQVQATKSELRLLTEGRTLLRFTPAPSVTPAA